MGAWARVVKVTRLICMHAGLISTCFGAGDAENGIGYLYRAGLWSSLESLQQCEVIIECISTNSPSSEPESVQMHLWWDVVRGNVRFERSSNGRAASQFIRTTADAFVHLPGRGVITRHAADYDARHLVETQVIDPRVFGITQHDEWNLVDYGQMRALLDRNLESFERGPNGEGVLAWEYDFGPPAARGQRRARRVISVDKDKGYSPMRLEEYYGWLGENFDAPWFTSTIERKEGNGIWVPVRVTHTANRANICSVKVVQLRWISVNVPLPDELFCPSGLDAPGGTLIANMRVAGGFGVVEDMIPRDGEDDLPGGPTTIAGRSTLLGRDVRLLWVSVHVVAVVMLTGFVVLQRRAAGRRRLP